MIRMHLDINSTSSTLKILAYFANHIKKIIFKKLMFLQHEISAFLKFKS